MADKCADGGLKAQEEFLNLEETKRYIQKSNKVFLVFSDVYCGKAGVSNYIKFLEGIINECPNHSLDIEKEYYLEKLHVVETCSEDSVTGKSCDLVKTGDFNKPYSEWDPSECESSCVNEFDAIYREMARSPVCDSLGEKESGSECKNFKLGNNPTCGIKTFAEVNSATTLSSYVTLFSLIICILFVFFK